MIGFEVIAKTYSLAAALWNGKNVSKERIQARLEICAQCDNVVQKGKLMRCDICGCRVAEAGLINLARYEETALYGCKHDDGSQWKKNGV